ncbi:hypothetical protein MKZ38_006601 [Zalerion maritima]|uniref:Major facilitator superfamily (MFS) profile domain-containing protein n=1 Tax=Zalerion maritima TaxID=339359 RepID=A0AAD5RIR3_9PEZI|nr:hypothetical protein MKZ38_006601 [Zalerion maritima]
MPPEDPHGHHHVMGDDSVPSSDNHAGGSSRPPAHTWRSFFSTHTVQEDHHEEEREEDVQPPPSKWSMGVLNDKKTIEVPGSVLLLAKDHNEPLGLRNAPARTSHSSLPTGMPVAPPPRVSEDEKKKTDDGIILEPQPDDSVNDPLNWPAWRRDSALLCLGFYCMVGGGMTPLLAAGFTDVAADYGVDVEDVALTAGFSMLGLGLGSVIASPTAILYGKRPVYLASAILYIVSSIWCAVSPTFISLVIARIFQGMAVSPVECLPSATIAEIFFLHERAFRIGIYTLLLLGGKNLIPLISAAIIGNLGWRWVFWIISMIIAFSGVLLFLFVPETFWDRTPVPKVKKPHRPNLLHRFSSTFSVRTHGHRPITPATPVTPGLHPEGSESHHRHKDHHVGFVEPEREGSRDENHGESEDDDKDHHKDDGHHIRFAPDVVMEDSAEEQSNNGKDSSGDLTMTAATGSSNDPTIRVEAPSDDDEKAADKQSHAADATSTAVTRKSTTSDRMKSPPATPRSARPAFSERSHSEASHSRSERDPEKTGRPHIPRMPSHIKSVYTHHLRHLPAKSWVQQMQLFHGRLNPDNWFKVMLRPFILYTYPSVLWSSAVYACSVGWLIVISETMAVIYRDEEFTYHFTAMQTGLVYISPFIGGILGSAVAGKFSDVIVKLLSRRNGGLYEPEFRLIMAFPVAITTVMGLMGFGWSAEAGNHWMVPTFFFGLISFGCSLGSTTAITFCVDSYRQYAGEALVTLNFTKNICHGLVFSLFVAHWMHGEGPKEVFMWIGIIQLVVLITSIPMYIYGKRCRMWTVRKNFMEKF